MITDEEFYKIDQFRRMIPPGTLSKERLEDDHFLVRWLRARHHNLDKALEMLIKSMKWRELHKADEIDDETIPLKYRRMFPSGVLGRDYEDCVVLLLPLGRYAHRILLENEGMDKALRFNMLWVERMMGFVKEAEKATGRRGLRLVEIIDMEHLSYKEVMYGPSREFLLQTNKVMEENYPEMLKSLIIINAPNLFALLFNMLKPFISKETLDKVSIYGSDEESWKRAILAKLDPRLVPRRWGGVRQGKDDYCSDDTGIWIDGPVPLNFFTQDNSLPPEEGFKCEKIRAREKFQVEVPVNYSQFPEGTRLELRWKYRVEAHDIDVSMTFDPARKLSKPKPLIGNNKSETSVKKDKNKQNSKDLVNEDEQPLTIISVCKTDCKQGLKEGAYAFDSKAGSFTLVFDNRHSFTRSKIIYYSVELSQVSSS